MKINAVVEIATEKDRLKCCDFECWYLEASPEWGCHLFPVQDTPQDLIETIDGSIMRCTECLNAKIVNLQRLKP
jgi:hypothetical protein